MDIKKLLFAGYLIVSIALVSAQTVSPNKTVYTQGDNIVFTYTGASGTTDWIGVYRKGEDPNVAVTQVWNYVTSGSGTLTLSSTALGGGGFFEAHLFCCDGYVTKALSVNFEVKSNSLFQMDTIQYRGDANKYINIVIMGDGYTSAEQATFKTDATNLSNYLFTQSPYSNYKNYFNVFAIKVVSTQSGAKHPNTASDCPTSPYQPTAAPTTYLGCTFDYGGIHRLIVPTNSANIAGVLSSTFPNYDQVLIIANSTYYGGSGGSYATSSKNSSSPEITVHELGHSFAGLSDEYYAGDGYAAENLNMTQNTNATTVRWKNWMGVNGIGINQHCCGGNSSLWYKPYTNCKMQVLGTAYCSVCKQAVIEKIHSLVNPIVTYTPPAGTINSPSQYLSFRLTELMKPISNTLKITWKLDGTTVSNNTDSVKINQNNLSTGNHTLVVTVTDTTSLLKVNNHSTLHVSTVTWTINKSTTTGIELTATDNQISYAVYPNPAMDFLNVSVELEKSSNVTINVVSVDGKVIKRITNQLMNKGTYLNTINIQDMVNGIYFITFDIGGFVHTQTFVKQ